MITPEMRINTTTDWVQGHPDMIALNNGGIWLPGNPTIGTTIALRYMPKELMLPALHWAQRPGSTRQLRECKYTQKPPKLRDGGYCHYMVESCKQFCRQPR